MSLYPIKKMMRRRWQHVFLKIGAAIIVTVLAPMTDGYVWVGMMIVAFMLALWAIADARIAIKLTLNQKEAW